MAPENSVIEPLNLVKHFGDVTAVESVSFSVNKGELFGFLGPNGAGKTTTINMLTGQHLIGVVLDESNLYPELTGFENLCFCAALYGLGKAERQARARDLLDSFGLTQAADRKFAGYSKGMKRKLAIAAGIIQKPEILFLDEPTTGIDVASARHIRQLIDGLHRAGTTIFLTTHYIEEAERLCDRIAFILSGRIVRIDTVENLIQPDQAKHIMQITCTNTPDDIQEKLSAFFPDLKFQTLDHGSIRVEAGKPVNVGPLVRFLEEHGAEVMEARRVRFSLEDVFVRITGIEAGTMHKEKEKTGGDS